MLEFTFESLEQIERLLDPKLLERALRQTTNRVANRARTFVSREVRKEYNIKAGDLNNAVRITRNVRVQGETGVIIEWRGRPIPIDKFSPSVRTVGTEVESHTRQTTGGGATQVRAHKSRRRAVTARVKKASGRKVVPGAFPIQDGKAVFERKGERQHPIKRVYRLSVAQMVNQDILDRAAQFVLEQSNIELDRNLRFNLTRASR